MDPRPHLFAGIAGAVVTASLSVTECGVVTPMGEAVECAEELGLQVAHAATEGALTAGDEILRVDGTPMQIALAEERLLGILGKPSGIATAARRFVEGAAPVRVVSGGWKKLPFSQKEMIRSAITAGGATPRIAEWPFAYLDKNFVRMLGGPLRTLAAADGLEGCRRVIQLGRSDAGIAADAVDAALGGADIVFVDTGDRDDLIAVAVALRENGLRDRVELAFGGGVTLADLDGLRDLDVDILDVGRPIVDAPLLDMRVAVTSVRVPAGGLA